MNNLETGKDKIKKICELLKSETLQPAKKEAQKMLEVAEQKALQIIRDAEIKADTLLKETSSEMERKKRLFKSSMETGARQALEALRQDIENKLFNKELSEWIEKETVQPKIGAKLITALIQAIEQEGTSADFSALIPATIPAEKINALLVQGILKKLREKSVVVGDFIGGAQLKLHDHNLTLDVSDEALKELIGHYIRKDFRELLFQI